jgi:transcriptional regulator with XRE-family HTH domain
MRHKTTREDQRRSTRLRNQVLFDFRVKENLSLDELARRFSTSKQNVRHILRTIAREQILARDPNLSGAPLRREIRSLLRLTKERPPFSIRKVPLPDEELRRILSENKDQTLDSVRFMLHRLTHAKGKPITREWMRQMYRRYGIERAGCGMRSTSP